MLGREIFLKIQEKKIITYNSTIQKATTSGPVVLKLRCEHYIGGQGCA